MRLRVNTMGPVRFFIVIRDDGSSIHFINEMNSRSTGSSINSALGELHGGLLWS
jgi:hypothetical protein